MLERGTGSVAEHKMLWLRRSAGVLLSVFQMVENFSNDFVLCDEGDHAEGAPAVTFQGVDLIDPPNELSPTFSESGALFTEEICYPRALRFPWFQACRVPDLLKGGECLSNDRFCLGCVWCITGYEERETDKFRSWPVVAE